MKTCFKCLCAKPLEMFYKHPPMKDGRLNKCIECTKSDVAKHRQENLERIRAYDRFRALMPHRVSAKLEYAKTQAYKQSHKATAERWKARHPERRSSHVALGNAIRDGRLEKLPCLVCGETKVQGHHPDYSQPLQVVWLCVTHHKQIHKEST